MIGVAILGAGIGAQHMDAFTRLPNNFTVLYVVDRDVDRALSLTKGTATRAVESPDIALADPSVTLVDVCLPPFLHQEFTLKALTQGKHVVCEKPLATSLADAHILQRASAETGRKIFPVFQYRWGKPILQMRKLIEAGLAGTAQAASIETHWCRGTEYYATPWRGTWNGEQGGAVLGHAIHNHDLLCHIMGDVRSLSAFTATRANPIETEDCAAILFELQCGALATSSVTLGAATDETRLRFVFEHVTVTSDTAPYAPGSAPWRFEIRTPELRESIQQVLQSCNVRDLGFAGLFAEIARDLCGEANDAVTFADGLRSIELVTAIYSAGRTGQRVSLPLPDDHPLYGGWCP